MHKFLRNTLSRQTLQRFFVKTALGNFVGYVAGSAVTLLATYHSVERRALKNLFGILPRHTVVVHRLPEWLEWTLSVLLGFLVMEFVQYILNGKKYLVLLDLVARDKRDDGADPQAVTGGTGPTRDRADDAD